MDYSTINVAFFKESTRILNEGGVICIFPEGVINPRKYGFFDFSRSYVMDSYDPKPLGYKKKADGLRIQLEPRGERGYWELLEVERLPQ